MSMSDMHIEIQEYIESTSLSFQEIAKTLNIPVEWVYDVAETLGEFDE